MFNFFRKKKRGPVWRNANGIIACPGDACPQECDYSCPIYLNTTGVTLLSVNKYQPAIEKLEEATVLAPDFYDAWNNLGAAFGSAGRHKDAYGAYAMAHRLNPNSVFPLFGLALCCKDLGRDEECLKWCDAYNNLRPDGRVASIQKEVRSRMHPPRITSVSETSSPASEDVRSSDKNASPIQLQRNARKAAEDCMKQTEELRKEYGRQYMKLFDENTRDEGYKALEKLESSFPEAGIVVGQRYLAVDPKQAYKHFEVAANAGIAEGYWGAATCLDHSFIPDPTDSNDVLWEKYCLAAAERGCADAANELGNICHRKNCHAEAMYWYHMAFFLEQPDSPSSIAGTMSSWVREGCPEDYRPGTKNYTKERHETALIILKIVSGEEQDLYIHRLLNLALNGDELAGFYLASLYENEGNNEMAFKIYNALAFREHVHSLRCFGDFKAIGRGTLQNIPEALKYYEKAADKGDPVAMFIMGQNALNDNNINIAAYWLGAAYSRGYENAGELLARSME